MRNLDKVETEVIQVNALQPEPSIIERAANVLRSGNVAVFPTETVYGLGADVFQPAALERIFLVKGRPHSDPLIAHIADEAALELLTSALPEQAKRLASAFWPGPLTLVLSRGPRVPYLVTAGLETVAVRMPRHPVALALIRALGSPIAAPSANRFMHVSPTTAQHVLADLGGRVPLILDGGSCEVGVESTVLDLCSEQPTILRPGGISLEALRAVLPNVQPPRSRSATNIFEPAESEAMAQHSPGQMHTHYAPSVPLLLFEGSAASMRAAMLAEMRRRQAQGERVGILTANEDVAVFRQSEAIVCSLGNAANSAQIAAALFHSLRALEDAQVQVILCRQFDDSGLGLAIRDRLLKAASGRVIETGQ